MYSVYVMINNMKTHCPMLTVRFSRSLFRTNQSNTQRPRSRSLAPEAERRSPEPRPPPLNGQGQTTPTSVPLLWAASSRAHGDLVPPARRPPPRAPGSRVASHAGRRERRPRSVRFLSLYFPSVSVMSGLDMHCNGGRDGAVGTHNRPPSV